MLVDVHAHLDHPLIAKELDELIERAKKAGVKAVITSGINPSTNRENLEISKKYDIVKCSLGFYPQDALLRESKEESYPKNAGKADVEEEIKFIEENKNNIVAIGEVGLDYFNGKDKETQKKDFLGMIKLSKKICKPLIVHSRKAESDVVEMLEQQDVKKVVLHCFCGKKKLIKRAAKNGWFFSVPPNIVRAENFQILVDIVPLSQLLTETDAPFLSPYKDKLNEPAFVKETIKKIAEIKGMTEIDVENNVFMNYQRLFL